jgi:hypothetical protein
VLVADTRTARIFVCAANKFERAEIITGPLPATRRQLSSPPRERRRGAPRAHRPRRAHRDGSAGR